MIPKYLDFLPPNESQISLNPIFDTNSCGIFGSVHYCEIYTYARSGKLYDGSERAASVLAGIQNNVDAQGHIWGSYIAEDWKVLQKYGLPSQALWPDLTSFTKDQWFEDVPQNVIDSGKRFDWTLGDLIQVPLDWDEELSMIEIVFPNGAAHFVVKIPKVGMYFDSYIPCLKPVGYNGSKIINQWTAKLTPKPMKLYKDNRTTPPTIVAGFEIDAPENLKWIGKETGVNIPVDAQGNPDWANIPYSGQITN